MEWNMMYLVDFITSFYYSLGRMRYHYHLPKISNNFGIPYEVYINQYEFIVFLLVISFPM